MARIVDHVEELEEDSLLSRFRKFPLASGEWTDGQTREVTNEGDEKDFSVAITTFRVYLYQWQDAMNQGLAPSPDVSGVVANRWRDPAFRRGMQARGINTVDEAQRHYELSDGWIWKARTHIVSPGVIRFCFEPDDQ